jgi:hypothetical protein
MKWNTEEAETEELNRREQRKRRRAGREREAEQGNCHFEFLEGQAVLLVMFGESLILDISISSSSPFLPFPPVQFFAFFCLPRWPF